MRVALYARVSSEKQAEKDLSLPAQLKALREYALKRQWTIVEEFIDEAESARTADRPEFQRMITSAKHKDAPFNVILVWKLNRFARNREDSIIYKSLLRKRGIQVISTNENIDEGPTGKLLEGIIESIDEFYSANLSQDTIRGLKENAMRGFWNGGIAPFGYDFDFVKVGNNTKRKLKINKIRASIVKKIFSLSLEGVGIKEIAKALNQEGFKRKSGQPWTNSSISYILNNPIYTGCLFWDEGKHNPKAGKPVIKVPNTHPAIISEGDFNEARKQISSRSRKVIHPRALGSRYLLSGILRCKKCGSAMTACSAKSGKFHYYFCQTYLKKGREYCDQKLIPVNKIEPLIIQTINKRILTEENIRKLLLMLNAELRKFDVEYKTKLDLIDEGLEDKLKRRAKIFEGIETGAINLQDIAPRLKELNTEIAELEQHKQDILERHQNGDGLNISDEQLKPYTDDLIETLSKGAISERKSFIRSFVKRITVNYPQLELEYTFPLPIKGKDRTSTREVLSLSQFGVANGI
ncbi:MAG: recombinase family protein [bacterium]|nr:recombinase family protein [bacterium]MDD5757089.1 recombinase family protein [bacterium]